MLFSLIIINRQPTNTLMPIKQVDAAVQTTVSNACNCEACLWKLVPSNDMAEDEEEIAAAKMAAVKAWAAEAMAAAPAWGKGAEEAAMMMLNTVCNNQLQVKLDAALRKIEHAREIITKYHLVGAHCIEGSKEFINDDAADCV